MEGEAKLDALWALLALPVDSSVPWAELEVRGLKLGVGVLVRTLAAETNGWVDPEAIGESLARGDTAGSPVMVGRAVVLPVAAALKEP